MSKAPCMQIMSSFGSRRVEIASPFHPLKKAILSKMFLSFSRNAFFTLVVNKCCKSSFLTHNVAKVVVFTLTHNVAKVVFFTLVRKKNLEDQCANHLGGGMNIRR